MLARRTVTTPERRQSDAASWIATVAIVLAFASGAILAIFPHLDVAVAKLFYSQENKFIGADVAFVDWLRITFWGLFIASCMIAAFGLIITRCFTRVWLGLAFAKWVFFATCLTMGPGVVANLVFKEHWGRARPSQITEFAGNKNYTSAFTRSKQCDRNCSFVSGEASSLFIVFFSLAFLFRRQSRSLVAAGVTLGAAAGLVRMIQGAHFLSDIVFAGVLMALTAALVNFVFEVVADDGKSNVDALQTSQVENPAQSLISSRSGPS